MALEQYKNIPDPTAPGTAWAALNGAIDATQTSIVVTAATNFPGSAPYRIRIDQEYMLVTAGAGTTTWTVTRNVDSSTGATHVNNASIFHALTRGGFLNNPLAMTTSGDLPYLDSNGNQARLASPANGGYIVTWTSAVPSWTAAPLAALAAPADGDYGIAWASGVPSYDPAPSFTGLTVTYTTTASAFIQSYAAASALTLKRFNNTEAAPRRVLLNQTFAQFTGRAGYAVDDTTNATMSGDSAAFTMYATENWTSTGRGSAFRLYTTLIGTTTVATRLQIDDYALYFPSMTGTVKMGVSTNINGTGGTYCQTYSQWLAKVDSAANYFDASLWLGAWDGTNVGLSYAIGTEGNWTQAGGFTTYRWYLWDYVNSRTVAYIDGTMLNTFKFDTGTNLWTNANHYMGGATTIGTSAAACIVWKNGTAPSSNIVDSFHLYAADQAAGNSTLHIRTELGSVIKFYQVATYTVTNAGADRAFDANAVTIDELADVLGTLIADIKLTGLLA